MSSENRSKTRNVETLTEYNEKKHLDVIKQGDLERYENEYHLIEQTLDLPQKFVELDDLAKQMVLLFIDKDFVEPYSGKHTQNDSFVSFLASYDNKTVIKSIFTKVEKVVGHTKDGDDLIELITVPNPDKLHLYIKMKTHATQIWKKYNLKEIAKSMREIMANNGYRDEELLEQKIVSDALSDERDSFTMQNRRVAVDIKGMKKAQGLQQINVFLKGGGKEASKVISDTSGNDVYDLVPDDDELEEVETVKNE